MLVSLVNVNAFPFNVSRAIDKEGLGGNQFWIKSCSNTVFAGFYHDGVGDVQDLVQRHLSRGLGDQLPVLRPQGRGRGLLCQGVDDLAIPQGVRVCGTLLERGLS